MNILQQVAQEGLFLVIDFTILRNLKSPLCLFHNIDLCAQNNAIKTSYQESENFHKNLKQQSATMQAFGFHFYYNFLMDFYQNEEIVKKQERNLAKHLKEGPQIIRDKYHLVMCNQFIHSNVNECMPLHFCCVLSENVKATPCKCLAFWHSPFH